MHFSIPDTQEIHGDIIEPTYTCYNIYINGNYHCSQRFKELHSLHEQLKKEIKVPLPSFPPKNLLRLTNDQIEQRRKALERYMQIIGQDSVISKSECLRNFLLYAQHVSSSVEFKELPLEVHLMDGYAFSVICYTNSCSYTVLQNALIALNILPSFQKYFSLFLMKKTEDDIVLRKLMEFECPYLSQRVADDYKIVLRKSYWDPCYDNLLMLPKGGLEVLFRQVVSDIENGWMIASPDILSRLKILQKMGKKEEYIHLARTIPSYGCIQFANAIVNYPEPNSKAMITIGYKELSIRTYQDQKIKETKFRVTRMRCWRITTIQNEERDQTTSNSKDTQHMELSFEYLMSKNSLQWITIISDQAMLMSAYLQSLVDELVYQQSDVFDTPTQQQTYFPSVRKFVDFFTSIFRSEEDSFKNEAFEGIGDDDL